MHYRRDVCHHCHRTESDPRRLIEIAYPFVARHSRGYPLSRHTTHVDCFLSAGGSIDGLADSQLWHVPTSTWQRLGYLPGDSRMAYLDVLDEEREQHEDAREAARLIAELAARAAAVRPDYRTDTVMLIGPHAHRTAGVPPAHDHDHEKSGQDARGPMSMSQLRRAA